MQDRKVSYTYINKLGEKVYYTESKNVVYKKLVSYLRSKYIYKAPWITRLSFAVLYDGYERITIYEDNGTKDIFIIERSINEYEGE